MIDGLKLTMTGEELVALLAERMEEHERRAERWHAEQTDEAEWHEWRVDVLGFIRDHIDASEVYRLAESDLEFAELLPEKPGWMAEQGLEGERE